MTGDDLEATPVHSDEASLPMSSPILAPTPTADRPPRKPSAYSLAARLEKVTENLDAYINERAFKMASAKITSAQREAEVRIAEVEREALIERQRAADLIDELRRQMAVGHRRADALQRRINHARAVDHDAANQGRLSAELRLSQLLESMPPSGRLSDYARDEGN